jgi:hypothetical protein
VDTFRRKPRAPFSDGLSSHEPNYVRHVAIVAIVTIIPIVRVVTIIANPTTRVPKSQTERVTE